MTNLVDQFRYSSESTKKTGPEEKVENYIFTNKTLLQENEESSTKLFGVTLAGEDLKIPDKIFEALKTTKALFDNKNLDPEVSLIVSDFDDLLKNAELEDLSRIVLFLISKGVISEQ